ncbi:hypothetical protein C8R47DRAFT_1084157 [Mycena vitilis]|nr:hypothetical protein C8R47DRAFT_1084157 [Mycena vitilis]
MEPSVFSNALGGSGLQPHPSSGPLAALSHMLLFGRADAKAAALIQYSSLINQPYFASICLVDATRPSPDRFFLGKPLRVQPLPWSNTDILRPRLSSIPCSSRLCSLVVGSNPSSSLMVQAFCYTSLIAPFAAIFSGPRADSACRILFVFLPIFLINTMLCRQSLVQPVSAANSLLLSYSHHRLFSSLAQRPHYQLRPASARSVTITPPQKSNKKGKAVVVAKPTIHPSYTPAQVKALWAPLVCAPVQALLPLLTTGAVARRSSAQLQSLFAGAEKVLRRFREETETGPIEIEAFLLSIWVAVREAKRAYPEFPWKTQFPTLYNLVPNDLPRRAEIETFVPSLPDSSFTLPEIPAHLQFASSDDDEPEAPPPTKKARYQSPSVVPDTPPPQPSSSRRQRSPPAVERPKPKPTGKTATLASRRHHVSESLSPEVEEAPRPKKNVHHFDQAADLEAYARHTHETGYVSDGFDAAVEVYPRLIDHPQGGVLAPHVAVEKVPTAVVHDDMVDDEPPVKTVGFRILKTPIGGQYYRTISEDKIPPGNRITRRILVPGRPNKPAGNSGAPSDAHTRGSTINGITVPRRETGVTLPGRSTSRGDKHCPENKTEQTN